MILLSDFLKGYVIRDQVDKLRELLAKTRTEKGPNKELLIKMLEFDTQQTKKRLSIKLFDIVMEEIDLANWTYEDLSTEWYDDDIEGDSQDFRGFFERALEKAESAREYQKQIEEKLYEMSEINF